MGVPYERPIGGWCNFSGVLLVKKHVLRLTTSSNDGLRFMDGCSIYSLANNGGVLKNLNFMDMKTFDVGIVLHSIFITGLDTGLFYLYFHFVPLLLGHALKNNVKRLFALKHS